MSKRGPEPESTDRPPKRSRQEVKPSIQEIHFARQVQDLLTFRQDGLQQLRDGIASFKAFLENILYRRDADDRARQLSILREYLESQRPPESQDFERPFLHQLWQAWSFADQNNDDHLGSRINSILAQLLKALSGLLDFQEYGILLCKTVLQHQHLRLLKRALSAPNHKEFIISPSLRLLTEVSSFDGGIFARQVYRQREQTFDTGALRRNLALVKTDIPEEELRRKPSIRTLAVRYVLTLLKHLHEGGKADLLKSRPLCIALFAHLHNDPVDLVNDFLHTTEHHVFKDNDVPRLAKANLLLLQNLQRMLELATRSDQDHPAANKAFDWLKSVCTKSSYGIFRFGGLYPIGTATRGTSRADRFIDLGLESIDSYNREAFTQVRNTMLLSWIQTLRPHSNLRERELLLTCFAAAPELVAAYFAEKSFQMDPKLSNTWIGYASTLFEVICQPTPPFMGNEGGWAELPPQTAILLESVLPSPLSQKILVRCLNQSHELITFFAIRVLIKSYQKLDQVLQMLRSRAKSDFGKLWEQAADRLLSSFTERCPAMKDVVQVFRQIPDDDSKAMQREAITRLLLLVYQITPLPALEEQFDVSGALASGLTRDIEAAEVMKREAANLRSLELGHVLKIAGYSPGMRWFHKQGALQHSPVVALLKLHVQDVHNKQIRQLLSSVLTENNVLSEASNAAVTPIDALVASLVSTPQASSVWNLVDDCIARAYRQPVKYVDMLDEVRAKEHPQARDAKSPVPSPLIAVIYEQATFIAAKDTIQRQEQLSFVGDLLEISAQTSSDKQTISSIQAQIKSGKCSKYLPKGSIDTSQRLKSVAQPSPAPVRNTDSNGTVSGDDTLPASYGMPPAETESHPELYRWQQKEFDMAFEDGDINALILCLCSEHIDIRMQARVQLSKLMLQLRNTSSNDNAKQLCVLVGQLCETFERQYQPRNASLPYLAGTFAVRALQVQSQPSHSMYPKLNEYFIRGPEWRVKRLPSYWLSRSVLSTPADDDAYWREVQWVLDWLTDGLRTTIDLEILRRSDVFERFMTLWISPGAARQKGLRDRILELLLRTTYVEGGSAMLVTRMGLLTWLDMNNDASNSVIRNELRRRIAVTCDSQRLQQWAGTAALPHI